MSVTSLCRRSSERDRERTHYIRPCFTLDLDRARGSQQWWRHARAGLRSEVMQASADAYDAACVRLRKGESVEAAGIVN